MVTGLMEWHMESGLEPTLMVEFTKANGFSANHVDKVHSQRNLAATIVENSRMALKRAKVLKRSKMATVTMESL